MQPGSGLPRCLSYLGKRCFPRRFRDSAAQVLELPQHNSGVHPEPSPSKDSLVIVNY